MKKLFRGTNVPDPVRAEKSNKCLPKNYPYTLLNYYVFPQIFF